MIALPLTLGILALAVLLTPLLVRLLGRNANLVLAALDLAAAVAFLPAVQAVLPAEHAGGGGARAPTWSMPWAPAWDVNLALRADGLGVVFTLIALLIGAVVLAYAARYLPPGRDLSFPLLMAGFTLSMVALVLADDLVVLFIAWELTSIASFLLVARSGGAGHGASMRTLFITFVGGVSLLSALALIIVRTGTTSLSEALAHPVWSSDPRLATTVALLVALAAMTKSAQFPFHVWLPDAMAAITPVSAYLHAAAVVKAGIFLLLRFSPLGALVPAWSVVLIAAGLVTAMVGGVLALQQPDLKKLMAYSTVSQLGLIVTLIGVGTELALTAAVLHTIAHALFKSGLFMMVGVIDHAVGTRELRRMPALGRVMPVSFAVTVLGAASMAGIPPMLGFVSKESLLTGALSLGGEGVWGWVVALGIAAASVLTFAYCAKIVLGVFVDGRDPALDEPVAAPATADPETPHHDSTGALLDAHHAHRPGALFLGAAALPILVSVPLALVVGLLDAPVARAVEAAMALPAGESHVHLALWHGLTPELGLTAAVIALGTAIALGRRRLFPAWEARPFPVSGADVIGGIERMVARLGHLVDDPFDYDSPSRHLATIALAMVTVVGAAAVLLRGDLPPVVDGVNQGIDLLVLLATLPAVVIMVRSASRLAAVVAMSAVGILVTVQIIALGGADVVLTQLLVESLSIIVVMLVLQKLPDAFPPIPVRRQVATGLIAAATGLAFGAATFLFAARRGRSGIAEYFIDNTYDISGSTNVVNVILVEFRAFDTLGELSVLGFAGVAIVAVITTIRHRDMDPPDTREDIPAPALRPRGSTAHTAITSAWSNTAAAKLLLQVLTPILLLISLGLFLRGHNDSGGGFVAALVGSALVALAFLSSADDRQVGPPRLPVVLIGVGVLVGVGTGLLGFVEGSFLEPIHGYLAGQHLTTSMIFDVGVYMAVLGLFMIAVNLLGTSATTGDETGGEGARERADETIEGELPGPLPGTHGERPGEPLHVEPFRLLRPRRVGLGTAHLASGTPPKERGEDRR
ncbi:DUF4040 family protein [Brachybacterium sp. EF45031]|uniref:DUF4040 family protein n=1 Tax=Brachybacterium sillae TaxID=2810536 RepID=UPI00217E71E7|nr:DUF4040 family protein [Brachybacterium sillae]MCS6711943.1 DUF4040 family protein [Brachybacterium sillae]